MKKTILWSLVSAIMVLSLVLASCNPTDNVAQTTTGPKIDVPDEGSPSQPSTGQPSTGQPSTGSGTGQQEEQQQQEQTDSDRPQYGGVLTVRTLNGVDPTCCDSAAGHMMTGGRIQWMVLEQLIDYDWSRGPAPGGTGEFDIRAIGSPEAYMGPGIAESVEITEPGVWKLQIRDNMHWQPVDNEGGRLMANRLVTMDDVLYSYNRMVHGSGSAMMVLQPRVASAMEFEQTGPWELTIRTPVQPITAQWWVIEGGGFAVLQPKDVIEKYGNIDDWKMMVGTGPYMLEDYVPASQVTYKKNPDYYLTNPIGPGKGDKLPYIDEVRWLVIPDLSTTSAAVRTGKLEIWNGVPREDALQLINSAPGIDYSKYLPSGFASSAFNLNLSDPSKPWALTENGKKVRQAMMYAIDYNSIVNDYFEGEALTEVVLTDPNFAGAGYIPLENMAPEVRDLFSYNIDKAKQLMKEAGYPEGFKAELLVPAAPSYRADEAALVAAMWEQIGIAIDINVVENTALTTQLTRSFNWNDMFYNSLDGGAAGNFAFSLYTYVGYYRGDNRLQFASRLDPNGTPDPFIEEKFQTMMDNIYVNWPAAYKAVEELRPYLIENAFKIPFPQPYQYTLWWPWVKNTGGMGDTPVLWKYFWIDQALKKSMGH